MEYNTQRSLLSITEYGRNVHKMIEYALTLEDREQRNKAAKTIVAIMASLNNPQKQDNVEFRQKIWDHLFIISNYQLDVDSPFPKPVPGEHENEKYACSYPNKFIRYRQYGKNIENMIEKVKEYDEGPEKDALIKYVANHLKKLYISWNRDSVSDEVILEHLSILSDGQLKLPENVQLENTRDILVFNNRSKKSGGYGDNKNNKHRDKNWKRKTSQ
ncbi:MAG: DUF4290 domain-containing protein [Bacteroidales bacterium]|nr:DUF4290 domain-containing protein [Bacteroidales bacterium]